MARNIKDAQQKSETELAVDAYLAEIGVKFEVSAAGADLNRDGWKCDGWHCSFNAKTGAGEHFDFYTGTGHRVHGPVPSYLQDGNRAPGRNRWKQTNCRPLAPFAASVLYSLILEASADDMSFSRWCADYGYDSDSMKALNTYNACCENAKRMRKVFAREQVSHLSELLQDY